ncbi:hypothetical protein [Nonomuraea endophytica]|uniref:Uncharacterized protein n=1 Tax=Nonomuraea endophytica TaxID=714136 RepID=A0A7W8AAL6_9ACTN|nr:hypothetical protein [Nonomuraea endophytica]MBB5081710.1 hypothetical protein [Nonomuraea endophytica]
MPAFIVSMNALRVSERQQADALQAKKESSRANQRAFAQRVTVKPEEFFIVDPFRSGGTITVRNGNTLPVTVHIHIGYTYNNDTPGPDYYVMFDAPACSQMVYDIQRNDQHAQTFNKASSWSTLVATTNPLDKRSRLWSTGPSATPLTAEKAARLAAVDSISISDDPSTSRNLPTCM